MMRATIKARRQQQSLETTKTYILADAYIKNAADALGIHLDDRVTESLDWVGQNRVQRLHFYVLKNDFEDWKFGHGRLIGVEFRTSRAGYVFQGASRRHARHHAKHWFKCNRSGTHKTAPTSASTPEGHRKRSRTVVRKSIKVGCLSELCCVLLEKQRPDGSPLECYFISYIYGHFHSVGTDADRDNVGTQYLSPESRVKIETLLKRGGSVKEVLQRMQSSRGLFAKLGQTRIFRDDIITYEDVYNVYYQMMVKEIRKDNDPDISAQLWMEQLATEGYFSCWQRGIYYGFSSPWQLQKLKDNGKVFCFDGTHQVYGLVCNACHAHLYCLAHCSC